MQKNTTSHFPLLLRPYYPLGLFVFCARELVLLMCSHTEHW